MLRKHLFDIHNKHSLSLPLLLRCKAYNAAQLVVFMAEIFDGYMKQRLVEVALGRRRVKQAWTFNTIPHESVTHMGDLHYSIKSQSEEGTLYSVDLAIGLCTCNVGENGRVCKHQLAAAEYSATVIPQLVNLTPVNRRWIAGVALGSEKVPSITFFEDLITSTAGVSTEPVVQAEKTDVGEIDAEGVDDGDFKEIHEVTDNEEETTAPPKVDTSSVENTLATVAKRYGNQETVVALEKLQKALGAVKTTNQLNNILHMLTATSKRGAGRGKISCQPTSVARRKPGRPRGAAPLGKGRRPNTVKTKAKRPRNLALNIRENVANAKSHGSNH